MKRIRNLTIGAFLALLGIVFTACPSYQGLVSIAVDPSGDQEVEPGQTITWNVTLTPDATQNGALGDFYAVADQDTFFKTNLNGAEEAKTFQVNYTVPNDAQNGQKITVTFIAVDARSGLQNSVSVTLTVKAYTYVEKSDVTLTWKSTSLENQMMLVLTAEGISIDNAESTNGQIAYLYVGADNIRNTIASPNADEIRQAYDANGISYTTNDKQVTFFKRVTNDYVWDDIKDQDCMNINLDENSSDLIANSANLGYGVSVVQPNDIIEFYNPQTNVKGFIKIDSYQYAKGTLIEAWLKLDVKYVVMPTPTAK